MKILRFLYQEKCLQLTNLRNASPFYYSSTPKQIYRPKKEFKKNFGDISKRLKEELIGEILYGIHPIKAALTTQKRLFYKLFIGENVVDSPNKEIGRVLEEVERLGVEVEVHKKFMLNQLSAGRPHQGLCMHVSRLQATAYNKADLFEGQQDSRWLILDSVQDPMNFGSILRTSHYFGFNKIFINTTNNCSLTATVSKASAGVMEVSRVYSVPHMVEFVKELKERDWLVIGSTVCNIGSSVKLEEAVMYKNKKVAIVLGNEGVGIEKSLEDNCTAHIHIKSSSPSLSSSSLSSSSSSPPSSPSSLSFHLDSLNVNVVAGIVLKAFTLS